MACVAALVEATADLGQMTSFSSLVFLLVFAIVNAAALPHSVFSGVARVLPVLGSLGCLGAAVILGWNLARDEPMTLVIVGSVAAGLLVLRGAWLLWGREA